MSIAIATIRKAPEPFGPANILTLSSKIFQESAKP
jgi:hypothetical protein